MLLPRPVPCGLLLTVLAGCATAQATPPDPDCPASDAAAIWIAPARPEPGATLSIKAVLTDGPAEELILTDTDGVTVPVDVKLRGGPPWSLSGTLDVPRSGAYRIAVRRAETTVACRQVQFGAGEAGPGASTAVGWTRPVEAYYSAWIEQLFDAPPQDNLSFKSLEPVLRDPDRNFLHNYLGLNEDNRLPATPDCADLPYFLRTYFAWKIGLPVAFRACDRGTASRPPRCGPARIDDRFTAGKSAAGSFTGLMRQIADTVHSGSARTGLPDENTDFYPIPLERKDLWPGSVYADPYGHTLIVAQWLPQGRAGAGLLLAVDAQPDNSVARKRFWEGNFLFANTAGAGPGFKAFRPLVSDAGRLRLPSNQWLAVHGPVAEYSEQQDGLAPEDFYAALGKQINPRGLAPEQAYEAMLEALVEQLETRVSAIDNGETYVRQHRGGIIAMPSGAAIFQTIGPWEDYATPSRDLRLLIALKVIARLPDQIVRYPELFALTGRSATDAREAVERLHEQRIQERRFSYTRSDGSPWDLSVADVLDRREALTMGYNPNDCPEARWGAEPGSAEYGTCNRHAPADQRARMTQYRSWFQNTQRPPQ